MKNGGWFHLLATIGLFIVAVSCKKEKPIPETVADFDGNVYKTITIGSRVWLAENLKTHHFNDGTDIQYVTDANLWSTLSSPGCCYHGNQLVNKNEYGILYNCYAVGTGRLCPVGWHVSTEEDWDNLVSFLGGESVAGPKLMESGGEHWDCTVFINCIGTNESAFSARGGGLRADDGTYYDLGANANWWCESDLSATNGTRVYLGWGMNMSSSPRKFGCSVRCVMDR